MHRAYTAVVEQAAEAGRRLTRCTPAAGHRSTFLFSSLNHRLFVLLSKRTVDRLTVGLTFRLQRPV
jgi:hypothetical protein